MRNKTLFHKRGRKTHRGEATKDLSTDARSINVRELKAGALADVSIKDNALGVDDLSDKGDHADASVLALDGPAALEGLGLGVEPSKRVKDSKGLGNSKLELINHLHGGGGRGGHGRVERTSGGEEGGGESVLHDCNCERA